MSLNISFGCHHHPSNTQTHTHTHTLTNSTKIQCEKSQNGKIHTAHSCITIFLVLFFHLTSRWMHLMNIVEQLDVPAPAVSLGRGGMRTSQSCLSGTHGSWKESAPKSGHLRATWVDTHGSWVLSTSAFPPTAALTRPPVLPAPTPPPLGSSTLDSYSQPLPSCAISSPFSFRSFLAV